MKNTLKSEKGVSLISLAVAIIILVIITSMLVYNAKDTAYVSKLTNLKTDISNLRNNISSFYSKYGKIPAKLQYSIDDEKKREMKIGVNDIGDFYVIDLQTIDGLTLNYGRDYEKIKDKESLSNEEIERYTDLYIINEISHNIYYVQGVKVDDKIYYTDQEDIDTAKIDLKYVDGIKIPDGYKYIGKNNEEKICIENNESKNQYEWITIEGSITDVPKDEQKNDVIMLDEGTQTKEEFLESVNAYKGYYRSLNINNNNKYTVIYIKLDENAEDAWSQTYDRQGIYRDENGDTAYIPAGFKVSKLPTMNKINTGLVIQDATINENGIATTNNGNQYVWIKVPKSITENAGTYQEIEIALQQYVKDYRQDGYTDTWYDGCGIRDVNEYNNLKYKMLKSIKDNGGFYIARYEAGYKVQNSDGTDKIKISGANAETAEDIRNIYGQPVSKKNMYPYNFVNINQAYNLTYNTANDYTTSIMFGLQWDLVCKFLEETKSKNQNDIKTNSTNFGNYSNTEFNVIDENVKGFTIQSQKYEVIKDLIKTSDMLLTTGGSKRNKVLNIYDLAGNGWELTLEHSNNSERKMSIRGGCCIDLIGSLSIRNNYFYNAPNEPIYNITFRTCIF